MTSKNKLTTQAKTVQAEQLYFSPVAVLPTQNTVPLSTTYCFLSKVEAWNDENNPPEPTGDTTYLKQVFKNMFAAKIIKTSDVSPVIQRKDWSSGEVYDYYRDDIDMTAVDENGNLVYNFYVKNKYDQVFKCLWNNNGGASTDEPFFEPGSYNTNGIYQKNDGYKWKYIYTVDTGLKVKFMDDTWMPISVGANTPNPVQSFAGVGSIDVINVMDGGFGYDPANATISVVVTGDGSGVVATANVVGGSINEVLVTSPGTNYSFATANIVSELGSGAMLIAPTSPVGGHGFDPIAELGTRHVMITCEFSGSEGDVIPTNIDYHQVGLVVNPSSYDRTPYPANAEIYRTTTDFVVASGFGEYYPDDIVYQGQSFTQATFTARVLSFNTSTNVLYLINTVGTPIVNESVKVKESSMTRTLLSYSSSRFIPFSGYITYIENRTGIQRSEDGIEQFRFVLGY